MNGDLQDLLEGANPEDDQKLWALLARAKRPEASPYFARRVVREAAALPQRPAPSALWRGLKAWWQAGLPLLRPPRAAAWPGAIAAVVLCAGSLMMTFSNEGARPRVSPVSEEWHSPDSTMADDGSASTQDRSLVADSSSSGEELPATTDASLSQQDAEVIADLDSLMAREETHLWTDDGTTF